ncbi:MAG: EamA/RhaT family transporter, partial [Acidobacteria bacterium]|nr:EamA/RhaT family transporter [Candidatus Sulfomarinibacter sp. MAG AM1]
MSAALWGLDGVVLTPRLSNLQVPFVVFLLHAIPFVLMQPFLHSTYRRLRRMTAKGWSALALVAFTGGFLGTMAIVKALFLVDFNQLSVVVLLQKLQPVFALALAA